MYYGETHNRHIGANSYTIRAPHVTLAIQSNSSVEHKNIHSKKMKQFEKIKGITIVYSIHTHISIHTLTHINFYRFTYMQAHKHTHATFRLHLVFFCSESSWNFIRKKKKQNRTKPAPPAKTDDTHTHTHTHTNTYTHNQPIPKILKNQVHTFSLNLSLVAVVDFNFSGLFRFWKFHTR